ncbi:ABC transporter G family member 5 isoform X1 [Spinacia oleracea]|uniref:ABC transporter G family member 5 n=1 Tax=Spinacia oleracea TaxID=3562 RepID=A0A9R0J5H7_SPIOL|nr:ABC transporter G family member 5 isoform X1 [Spinacia oleracea]XP_021861763.1 ABC transporter G family member 5 isoform X1 [Spinacia oleracea]
MKKKGCEIEAVGITYKIYSHNNENPFSIFKRKDDQLGNQTTPSSSGMRTVLNQVTCRAKPWEILAIVGPSGAGKSSLLEILAGKLTPHSGSILINSNAIETANFNKISGYVTQKDMLFPLLTVEETLLFSAKLRLKLPPSELTSRVKSLMQELGLDHVANTRVGNDGIRGISGGERRRVSIGVDVIHDPKVLILDEPTSGLDSTSALQIIDMLKNMAETRGRTIILSIHQPGFRIVKLFNSILLLANGTVLHHGTVDQLGSKLGQMGLELLPHCNVVEFAIDYLETIQQQQQQQQENSALSLQQAASAAPQQRRKTLQQLFQQSRVMDEESAYMGVEVETHSFANSRVEEIMILSHRFSKLVLRTKELFACRTLQMLVSGLVLGSIFYDLKHDLEGAFERVGLFAFILTFLLSCTTEALPIFLQEKEILMKETSSGSYRVSSYVIANAVVYLPFLLILAILFTVPVYWLVGLKPEFSAFAHFLLLIWLILYTANSVVVCFSALVPNFIVGNSVISGVMGSFFLFSGYFISKKDIPRYWIGMHYVSLFKYPYEGFLINEFSGSKVCLESMFGMCAMTGKDVLKEEGLGEENRWRNVLITVGFILMYRFISYVVLRCKCSKRTFKDALI